MVNEQRLLLVDDDADHLLILSHALKKLGISASIQAAGNAEKAKNLFSDLKPQVVTLDLSLNEKQGPESGLNLLSELIAIDPLVRIIVLTGHSGNEYGIQAIARGAHAFLAKPAIAEHLKILIDDCFKQYLLREELKALRTKTLKSQLVGKSEIIERVREEILFAAQTPKPVLLLGETGTGKGVAAKMIFELCGGKDFIRYQPTVTNPELVASELFGHQKGAFTGAIEERVGLIKKAHQGVLFIDEIAELPLQVQVSFLGVLQDKKFRSLGSDKEIESHFKLISATNADLSKNIEAGSFRSDLFHRINHHVITMPALKERRDDIKILSESFLQKLSFQESLPTCSFTNEAISYLENHDFTGNVRELEAIVERGAYRALFEKKDIIEKQHLITTKVSSENLSFQEKVENYKISLIEEALRQSDGNQVRASDLLKLERSTLRRILARKL